MRVESKAEAKMLFKKLVTVKKCVGCNEPLDVTELSEAFCPKCREGYLSAKMAICPDCALAACECKCIPKLLAKDKTIALRRLFFYSKDRRREPQNKLIYFLKAKRVRRVLKAVAKELYPLISAEIGVMEEKPLIVAIPRSYSSLIFYGFDQSAAIARTMADLYGFEYCDVFKRRSGKPQKRLTAGERRKNIKQLVRVNDKNSGVIEGRTVILLDDVVTTGASMSACVQLLYERGAKNILCIALASDLKS